MATWGLFQKCALTVSAKLGTARRDDVPREVLPLPKGCVSQGKLDIFVPLSRILQFQSLGVFETGSEFHQLDREKP